MARLGGEELFVKAVKLGVSIRQRGGEELEALARARLDEGPDEQAIDEPGVFAVPRQRRRGATERGGVIVDGRRAETDAATREDGDHALEVLDLFFRDRRERAHEIEIVRVARRERERVRRRLHLAVRVIAEQRVDVADGVRHPRVVGRHAEREHGLGVAYVGERGGVGGQGAWQSAATPASHARAKSAAARCVSL